MRPDGFLGEMRRTSLARVTAGRAAESDAALLRRALATSSPPQWVPSTFDLIAECKRRSPSEGPLGTGSVATRAAVYAHAGAAVVSVLTEPEHFGGSLFDLAEAAAASAVPVMRKDFLVHPRQVFEARAAGAGGVLIVAAIVDDDALRELLAVATELDLFALVESFDEEDLDRVRALSPSPSLRFGLNCRDLRTLRVDRARLIDLAPLVPQPGCAESGLSSVEDVRAVARAGYRCALIGSALMRAAEPDAVLATLRAAGREAACA